MPHHLLDIWDVRQTASVADYGRLASKVIDDVTARGRVPVLAGGSGLYIRAALGDLNFPGTDPARGRLEAELAAAGPAALHARLAAVDPAAAAAILPGNGRRIVRALEVIELSGAPFTATLPAYESRVPRSRSASAPPRGTGPAHHGPGRAMWAAGFEDEVRRLDGAACATAGPRAARSATRRCSATWPGSGPWTRRARRPSGPPDSPAARTPGSAVTPGSSGWTPEMTSGPCLIRRSPWLAQASRHGQHSRRRCREAVKSGVAWR